VDAGLKKLARSWTWDVKNDKVTYEGPDSAGKPTKVSYTRANMPPDVVKDVDPNFINDQYWLLFPFHLVWDKDVTVEDKGLAADPTGKTKGKIRKVTVTYPKTGGGYTPGDMYDLFVGADNRAIAWNFHRGGATKPALTVTWADYKMAGPILISEDHRGTLQDKPFHLFFTDVAVKLAGSKRLSFRRNNRRKPIANCGAGNYWVLAGELVAGSDTAGLTGGKVDFAASGSLPAVSTTCCAR